MKRKSFRKAESAWCLRREEREETRHCLMQGVTVKTVTPSLQLLETPVCVVNFITTSIPVAHGQVGGKRWPWRLGCVEESRFMMHKDLLSNVPLRTMLLLSCRLLAFIRPEGNPSWGNCVGDLSN